MEGNFTEKRPIKVLIADDDPDTRVLLRETLADEPLVEVVGEAADTDEAIAKAGELQPDVALLDWVMPGGGGGQAARKIKGAHPETAVVALTGMDPLQASYDMLSAGAASFLQKGCSAEELVEGIKSAVRW